MGHAKDVRRIPSHYVERRVRMLEAIAGFDVRGNSNVISARTLRLPDAQHSIFPQGPKRACWHTCEQMFSRSCEPVCIDCGESGTGKSISHDMKMESTERTQQTSNPSCFVSF